MKKKNVVSVIILLAALLLCAAFLASRLLFVSSGDVSAAEPIGVIDGNLSEPHGNVTDSNVSGYEGSLTHGDRMLQFLDRFETAQVYYYDAGSGGAVSSEGIIEGLEWMRSNGVRYVNISMSSRQYAKDLADWIAGHQDEMTVFASFSNVPQSADYPAMYDGVIASGIAQDFADDTDDCIYRSYRIVVDGDITSVYEGNSFLSVWTMLCHVSGA